MARIKIKDLPKDLKISKEEMNKVMGGAFFLQTNQFGGSLNYFSRLRPRDTSGTPMVAPLVGHSYSGGCY